MDLTSIARHLDSLADAAERAFGTISEAEWQRTYPLSSGWTRAELLGHLIDSAINNQQRFVRAVIEGELHFPSYPQNEMVRVQNYRDEPVGLLTGLWALLNRHIARLLLNMPETSLAVRCSIGTNPVMTLEQVILDYVAHLEHHLRQLMGDEALPYSGLSWPPPDRWQKETGSPYP
jgi:hypothetical protein